MLKIKITKKLISEETVADNAIEYTEVGSTVYKSTAVLF